jgi:DDE superfamily endonuclease/Helix-turn-helix of DDE superfamily endonuclease
MSFYKKVSCNEKTFLSLTSVTTEEFQAMCPTFLEQWKKVTHQSDKRPQNGGRPCIFSTIEDRLFFILFYLKSYTTQEVIAHFFGMSQSTANAQIHLLSHVLQLTLKELDFLPTRISAQMARRIEEEGDQPYALDATERNINRPSNNEVQRLFYSGKKKRHTIKNHIFVGVGDRQIKHLSDTCEGTKHDKKMAEEENLKSNKEIHIYQDAGYQGLETEGAITKQPKKKPRGKELTEEEKENNRLISKVRIVVEHVISGLKRCRIVKDVLRSTKAGFDDLVMVLACGLHNFRSYYRFQSH